MKTQEMQKTEIVERNDNVTTIAPLDLPSDSQNQAQSVSLPASTHTEADAPEPGDPPYDPIKEWRIKSLIRRQRADAFVNKLNHAQQGELIDWFEKKLGIGEIHHRILEKWKMQISTTVLRRVRAQYYSLEITAGTEHMLDIITDLELDSDVSQAPRIHNALIHLLNRRAFEIALEAPGSEVINDIVANVKALSALEFKRQQIALEREKLQLSKQSNQTKHHRVDLNIVPPARPSANTVVVHSEPNPQAPPKAQLPPPNDHQHQRSV